jgi:uncharacterized repeat protein (TIGR01451 family)
MFRKLVSNIPYHPSMMGQLTFYLHRLRQEQALRRAGFVLFAMVLFVQLFAIVSPSRPSLATSSNDIVYGASNKDQVMTAYRNNRDELGRTDIRAIYNHYGIGLDQISAATHQKIGSHDRDYVSTGRSTSPGIDNFVNIDGVANGGIYQRPLESWDNNGLESSYDTLTGTSQHGFRFWIIIDGCGNIVFERGALKPKLEIMKKHTSPNNTNPGDIIEYDIEFRNSGGGSAKDVKIHDKLSKYYDFVSYTSNIDLKFNRDGQNLSWVIDNNGSELPPTTKWFFIKLKLKLTGQVDVDKVCNSANISANGVPAISVDEPDTARCINVIPTITPTPTIITPTPTKPTPTPTRPTPTPTRPTPTRPTPTPTRPTPTTSPTPPPLTPTPTGTPILSTDKSVANISQNISNANNTTAKPGDVLKYTIYVINNGDGNANNLKLSGEYGESINDILEYADLIDAGDAHFDKQTNYLTWDAVNIPANSQIQKSFSVKVKNPLPSTPISASDPLSYDFVIQNIYGRTINVKLDKPATKVIEQTLNTLPNTGPGTSMLITSFAAIIIGYFFYRNKLLSKELEMIHQEYSAGGI